VLATVLLFHVALTVPDVLAAVVVGAVALLLLLALPLPLPLPLKLPLVLALVTLVVGSGIDSLAAATNALSGNGNSALLLGAIALF
jgi:hypothetical protein